MQQLARRQPLICNRKVISRMTVIVHTVCVGQQLLDRAVLSWRQVLSPQLWASCL